MAIKHHTAEHEQWLMEEFVVEINGDYSANRWAGFFPTYEAAEAAGSLRLTDKSDRMIIRKHYRLATQDEIDQEKARPVSEVYENEAAEIRGPMPGGQMEQLPHMYYCGFHHSFFANPEAHRSWFSGCAIHPVYVDKGVSL